MGMAYWSTTADAMSPLEIGSENTDEAAINSFIDGMAERGIPLAAFHYDCYWMREFHWCDFEWDKRFFGDIESTLKRLHEDKGYLVRKPQRRNVQVWSGRSTSGRPAWAWWTSPTRPPVNGSRTRSRPC